MLYDRKSAPKPDTNRGETSDGDSLQVLSYLENRDYKKVKTFVTSNNRSVIFSTYNLERTLLHFAVADGHENIVGYLVNIGKEKLIKMQDTLGYTALAIVAEFTGNTQIAKKIVAGMKDQDQKEILTMTIHESEKEIPLLLAAAKGHKQMTHYLYQQTPLEALVQQNRSCLLLTRCITAEIFDVALELVQKEELSLSHQDIEFGAFKDMQSNELGPLYALADMPSIFPSGSQFGLVQRFFYRILRLEKANVGRPNLPKNYLCKLLIYVQVLFQKHVFLKFPGIRKIYEKKENHRLVLEILKCFCSKYNELEHQVASAMLQAAMHGIIEFIEEMNNAKPHLLVWGAIDKNKRGIISHAILNRRKEVFKFIDKLNGRKDVIKCCVDEFGDTLLHLAAHIGPTSDLDSKSGALLQMQREIQWFEMVKRHVNPKCVETKNKDGKKPHELFTEKHWDMVKAGEKWAKETASSFSVVGILITTIMFAAAFTIPGGNDQNTGIPMFVNDPLFTVFIVSDAISLFTSATSVLLFTGIITSRYAEEDFFIRLPLKLLWALLTLFFSVVFMMVSFCAALAMVLKGYQRIIIAAMSLASISIMFFVPAHLRLIFEIFNSMITTI